MIPKIIHYCWFGGNPKPKLAEKCFKSWRKYCPDYQIIEWNESNFDISTCPKYVQQAYEAKKWAFVTDYVRLKVVYENGGIYLDTDVEIIRPLDNLLSNSAYIGIEKDKKGGVLFNTGLGFGAEQFNPMIKILLDSYDTLSFLLPDGKYNLVPCTDLNTSTLMEYGFVREDKMQKNNDLTIYPSEYFCPMKYDEGIVRKTNNTYSIHRFAASWYTDEQQAYHKKQLAIVKKAERKHILHTLPNRITKFLIGEKAYAKLKEKLK